jgi:hypothetical protein
MRRFNKIIEEIKSLSSQQGALKAQRKTVHLKVERSIPAGDACLLSRTNGTKLMHLFIAYAQLRGKEPIFPKNIGWDKELVQKFVDTFQVEIVE